MRYNVMGTSCGGNLKPQAPPLSAVGGRHVRCRRRYSRETSITAAYRANRRSSRDDALRIIANNSGRIQWCKNLPHAAVIELFKNNDVGLLPTHHDTYGQSSTEAQSCGCPVISTDICALPEMNNSDLGWVVKTPVKDHEGGVSYIEPSERARPPEQIEEQLMSIIETIVSERSIVRGKGARCLN